MAAATQCAASGPSCRTTAPARRSGARPGSATTAFVVTDSQATFAGIAAELPDHVDVVRLYENYLTTFRIDAGGL